MAAEARAGILYRVAPAVSGKLATWFWSLSLWAGGEGRDVQE